MTVYSLLFYRVWHFVAMPAASSVKTWPSTHMYAARNSWAPGIQTLLGRYFTLIVQLSTNVRKDSGFGVGGFPRTQLPFIGSPWLRDSVTVAGNVRRARSCNIPWHSLYNWGKYRKTSARVGKKLPDTFRFRCGQVCCNNFHGLCSSRGHTSWFSLSWWWRQQAIFQSTRRPTNDTWISINSAVGIWVSPEDSHLRFGEKEIKILSETSPERETDDLWISRTSRWQHNPLTITAIK